MLRFTLVTGAWFVGLFGLMRLPWVERVLLTPFAEVQQRVADQLTGAPSDLVYADASCSGGDPLALCAGAIFAFPATWGSRLRGAAVGFTLITAFIGSYSVAIHAFSQTLVAVLLVSVAACRAARAAVAVTVGAVGAFAAAPVVGAVVGGAVEGVQALAGHAGHAFADEQGAWAILPAFQVGLFAALWVAVAGGVRSWRRALIGLGGMVLVQAALGVPVDELAHHYGFDPHVGLLRGWALALPAAAVWCLPRPAPFTVLDAPAPSGALRVTG